MNKQLIILDFDGILSPSMYYDDRGKKSLKQLGYGVRHYMDMLRWFGFRIVVISGDSTDSGRAMIKAMLANCGELELMFIDNSQKYVSLVQKFGNLSAAVYVGDDIHDAEIGRHVAAFYSIESAPSTLHPYALSMPTVGPHTFIEICDVMLTKHFKLAPQFYAQYAQPRYTFVNLFKYKFYDTIIFVGSDDDVDEDADPEAIWSWFMGNVDKETSQYIENNLIRPGRLNVQYATTSSQFVDDSSTTLIVPLPSISFSNAYESFIEKILLRQAEVLILSNKLSETTAKQWTAVSIYAYIKYMLPSSAGYSLIYQNASSTPINQSLLTLGAQDDPIFFVPAHSAFVITVTAKVVTSN
jgi:3-deoxy-D-manno-octulosonate 8-phosphate phosphatase KdsC-like HAD superfamily phosphatase